MAASRRAKALGVETKSVRMPRCNKQGGFEEVQCDNEIVSSCWCVDASGFELPGTRAPAASLVNCTGKYRVFSTHTNWYGLFGNKEVFSSIQSDRMNIILPSTICVQAREPLSRSKKK